MKLKVEREFAAELELLYRRRQFGIKPGIGPMRRMCEIMEYPQQRYGVIHIAGTNGKGSTAAIIASILQAAGLKTGLYTSPHLVRFNERIRVDGKELDDAELAGILHDCEAVAEQLQSESGHEATFFEIATLLAFEAFRRNGVRLAVIETGLGGRLDATNVVTPLVSVITGIALDHMAYLGSSLTDIAIEKGGIIKNSRPVVVGPQSDEAIAKLREIAIERQSALVAASEAVSVAPVAEKLSGQKVCFETVGGWGGTVNLPLAGAHQRENFATALAAVETLFDLLGIPLDPKIVKKGAEAVVWPGRGQLLQEDPVVIADAAHNPAGAKALVALLKSCGVRRAGIVLGLCDDKDAPGIVRILTEVAGRVWVVPIPGGRGMTTDKLLALVESFQLDAEVSESPMVALDQAREWARAESLPVVVTGSIFLLGEVLKKA
jgi:dihydrofolate synthase/folylpolyglutamate synthase